MSSGGADAVDEEPLVELVLSYLGEEDGNLILDAVGDDVGAGHDAVPAVRQVGVHEEADADAGRLLGRQVGTGKVHGRPVGFNANAGLFGVLPPLALVAHLPRAVEKKIDHECSSFPNMGNAINGASNSGTH